MPTTHGHEPPLMRARTPDDDTAAPLVPSTRRLPVLRDAAATCLACELGPPATQTVFGEGAAHAPLFLVGEQPGDEEDLSGHPFVGPAGKMLDRILVEAGIDRRTVYVTNAVKHFSFRPMGKKKRLHQKPSPHAVRACRPWLEAELRAVRPRVVVCLGATAAQSFFGPRFSVMRNLGTVFRTPYADALLVTYHPSALLRMPRGPARDEARARFLADLRKAAQLAHAERPS